MAEGFVGSYFEFLPIEVIIFILRKIEILDLVNFSEVYSCDEVLREKRLTSKIDLCNRYVEVQDLKWLPGKVNLDYVTTLNINGLYWVAYRTLSALLKNLSNLETLYAIDTKLDLSHEDIFNYENIKKVESNTIDTGQFLKLASLPHITKLTLQVSKRKGTFNDVGDLTAYHTSFRLQRKFTKCLISMIASERQIGSVLESIQADPDWSMLEESHVLDHLGPRDSQRLLAGEVNFQDMAFEELNFHHGIRGNGRAREAIIQILRSKNVRSLKKLSVSICQFSCQKCLRRAAQGATAATSARGRDREEAECSGAASSERPLKKAQNGHDSRECSHSAEHFLTNCRELEELEVWPCSDSKAVSYAYPFSLIGSLRRLRKLTLFLPNCIRGQFLSKVVHLCPQLEELRIELLQRNESLHKHVCEALPHAKCLRDFRYKNIYTLSPVEEMIKSLHLLETRKLQRIALFSDYATFRIESMRCLLEKNPQLVFFYISIEAQDYESAKLTQRVLDQFRKENPSKVFLIKSNGNRNYLEVPDCHFRDMVVCNDKVATLDAFHDFSEF